MDKCQKRDSLYMVECQRRDRFHMDECQRRNSLCMLLMLLG